MTQSDFSVGSVRRLVLSQAVPLIVAQVIQLLYNIVDRIYIGHLPGIGSMALTGLGITFPVVVLIVAFTTLFGMGGTTLFSLARGRGDVREADAREDPADAEPEDHKTRPEHRSSMFRSFAVMTGRPVSPGPVSPGPGYSGRSRAFLTRTAARRSGSACWP